MHSEPASETFPNVDATSHQSGVPTAELASLLYCELKFLARSHLQNERDGHTLTPTALVHEAFLKLQKSGVRWAGRDAFYHAASRAMWQILVDHARKRRRDPSRHAAVGTPRDLFETISDEADTAGIDVIGLDEHLQVLERIDPVAHRVISLRFIVGMTAEQTAEVLGIDRRTVTRRWYAARAWLRERMVAQGEEPCPAPRDNI